jgi:RNA polymerase sigma-70 factor (ECF subfamily)
MHGPDEGNALVRAYVEKRENLVLFLAARTRDMAAAEDLAQELYLKVAATPPEAVKSPAALLYRMAGNLLIDHVRSRQRASRREGQWRQETRGDAGGEEISQEPAADEVVIGQERVRLLAEAVAGLPPKMGQAFRLHKLEGKSQAETAQAMGVSVKMVEQHISAAIKNLAQRLRT